MENRARAEWITVTELQEILKLGRTKAYELLSTGEIPAVRIGRVLRVNRAELDRWLAQNRYRT